MLRPLKLRKSGTDSSQAMGLGSDQLTFRSRTSGRRQGGQGDEQLGDGVQV